MRVALLLMAALLAYPAAGASGAKTRKTCRQCRAVCGDAISECLAAAVRSCPTAPRGKARRCATRAKRHCRATTTARCVHTCKQTGSPECGTPTPAACVAYTSTCPAVAMTPVAATSPFGDQLEYGFSAVTGSPGPGGCCVIDTCAGITQFNANAGGINVFYHEVVFLDPFQHLPTNGSINTKVGVTCAVPTPVSVYGLSNVYRVNFSVDPRFSLPPAPPAWTAPYVPSAGDLSLSINSADDPLRSDAENSFTPSTWRLVDQTVGIDKVCAEQQSMLGHATASFIKDDGTPCTVTIYAEGTRVVAR